MITLPTLLISFALTGLVFTVLTKLAKKTKNTFLSFLQHFCGVWFVFSGAVKAVDPIGTAYKMEDYFVQFENTFSGLTNSFKHLAPVFPWLSGFSAGFSIFMIVLEITLGLMLILGYARRVTAWLFMLLVVFFTFLTGFTYLTGYVPTEANFFDFSQWGPYVKTQMRVTDCGCFGDFILLDPKVSFFKDLGLLLPAFIFLFMSSKIHELFTLRGRKILVSAVVVLSTIFCIQNTFFNLPVVDFRPFYEGANVRERKALEEEARGNIEITGWVMKNERTGEVKTIMVPIDRYKEVMEQCPTAQGWKVDQQIKTGPFIMQDGKKVEIKETKVSDWAIEDSNNNEMGEEILNEPGYSLMIVTYHLEGQKEMESVVVQDTVWMNDTLRISADSVLIQPRMVSVAPKKVERETFVPEAAYGALFRDRINPLAAAAAKAGWKVFALNTFQDSEISDAFRTKVGAEYPFYRADDKLLKTIIRSNPGIVIWKDGVVLEKYHFRHFPEAQSVLGKHK